MNSIQLQKEAIAWAWELLTKVYGLQPDRLYVSYFEGDAKQGLEPDLETKQIWLDLGVPEDHIVTGNAKDNFWGMPSGLLRRPAWLIGRHRDGCDWTMWAV